MSRPARKTTPAFTYTGGHWAAVIVAASAIVLGTATWLQGLAV